MKQTIKHDLKYVYMSLPIFNLAWITMEKNFYNPFVSFSVHVIKYGPKHLGSYA